MPPAIPPCTAVKLADDVVMKLLGEFKGARLINAEEATGVSAAAGAPDADGAKPAGLSDVEMDALTKWLGEEARVRPRIWGATLNQRRSVHRVPVRAPVQPAMFAAAQAVVHCQQGVSPLLVPGSARCARHGEACERVGTRCMCLPPPRPRCWLGG